MNGLCGPNQNEKPRSHNEEAITVGVDWEWAFDTRQEEGRAAPIGPDIADPGRLLWAAVNGGGDRHCC